MGQLIELCTHNYQFGTEKVVKKFEQNPKYDIVENNCLGHCEKCGTNPYVLLNGEYIEATDPDELIAKIEEKVEKSI
ncbi:hypothetical protein BHF71_01845 [Vulcanibacillus modesticaldus]|uniref:UDP-N-acetylmuramoylalanine--D-glutamate ligase n=1 Tax=Vulcanibacillus modesticaldus TaxID=337097 RepID=A0A1D2YUM7_9BACI|nr:DUF1450 domain-containing protein [Vulcanibacillus modesticaldus]OEF99355.1 hypothetical protein BHF71_01845 [Vulcanibacillus modesticaldus]